MGVCNWAPASSHPQEEGQISSCPMPSQNMETRRTSNIILALFALVYNLLYATLVRMHLTLLAFRRRSACHLEHAFLATHVSANVCVKLLCHPSTYKLILHRHSEAIEIMYSTNTFLFSSPFVITNFFLNHTLLSYRNLIRTVTISIGAPEPTPQRQGDLTFVTDRHIQQNLVAGAWDSIHGTLETFSNLRTVQIFIPDQRSSLSNIPIIQRDYGDLNNRIFQFFTYHKTKSALKSLEIYIPFLQVIEDDEDNLTLDHDPAGDHYATELQGQLNAEGVTCTVVAGGISTLGEQRPAAVK